MERKRIEFSEHYDKVLEKLQSPGLLLGTYNANGKPNVMTIGWGSVGYIWGIPIWTVLVRPSRFSYEGMEHSGCFTVNVPSRSMNMALATCGSLSGRDVDKFTECNLTAEKGQNVLAPVVKECPMVYECQTVHSNDVIPEKLADEILEGAYTDGDYHRIYFGKIIAAYASRDVLELL